MGSGPSAADHNGCNWSSFLGRNALHDLPNKCSKVNKCSTCASLVNTHSTEQMMFTRVIKRDGCTRAKQNGNKEVIKVYQNNGGCTCKKQIFSKSKWNEEGASNLPTFITQIKIQMPKLKTECPSNYLLSVYLSILVQTLESGVKSVERAAVIQ